MSCGCNKRVLPTAPAQNPLVPPAQPGTPSAPPVNQPQ